MTQEGQRVCALLDEVVNATTLRNAQQTLVDQLGFATKQANGIIDFRGSVLMPTVFADGDGLRNHAHLIVTDAHGL
jgi:hypothetical protein